MYYQSAITKKIVAENFAKCLDYVYGRGEVEKLIEEKTLIPIEEPSVEDCLRFGSGSVAVIRGQKQAKQFAIFPKPFEKNGIRRKTLVLALSRTSDPRYFQAPL